MRVLKVHKFKFASYHGFPTYMDLSLYLSRLPDSCFDIWSTYSSEVSGIVRTSHPNQVPGNRPWCRLVPAGAGPM